MSATNELSLQLSVFKEAYLKDEDSSALFKAEKMVLSFYQCFSNSYRNLLINAFSDRKLGFSEEKHFVIFGNSVDFNRDELRTNISQSGSFCLATRIEYGDGDSDRTTDIVLNWNDFVEHATNNTLEALAKKVADKHFADLQVQWLLKNGADKKAAQAQQEKALKEAQDLLIRHGFSVEKK